MKNMGKKGINGSIFFGFGTLKIGGVGVRKCPPPQAAWILMNLMGTKGRVPSLLYTVLILGITGPLPLFLGVVGQSVETPPRSRGWGAVMIVLCRRATVPQAIFVGGRLRFRWGGCDRPLPRCGAASLRRKARRCLPSW